MKIRFTDHLSREINVPENPQHILSICPAITETLFALGVGKHVVGRTKYCIFPKDTIDSVPTVGGTKDVDIEKVRELKPDLIIAEKEENTRETVEALSHIAPVVVFEVQTVDESYRLINDLGILIGSQAESEDLVKNIKTRMNPLAATPSKKVAYLIWRKPYMAVGSTTYIESILSHLGFQNVAASLEGRYPAITLDELKELSPDAILLSSEPFPFAEKHQKEIAEVLTDIPSYLVDGEMFWYGAKMLEASAYFRDLQQRINY